MADDAALIKQSSEIRKKRGNKHWSGRPYGRWVTIRKLVQYTALLVFVILFVAARHGNWPPELVNTPMRLDPLIILANLLATRTFLEGSTLALLIIFLTLVFGRAWCGWLCPMGTTLDLLSLKGWRMALRGRGVAGHGLEDRANDPPDGWRSAKYGLLLTILIAALFGNLTLLVFDPLTLLFRTLTLSIWPAIDQLFTTLEISLYPIPALADPISRLDMLLRPNLLPSEPVFYRQALLYAGVFAGVISLNLFTQRFWCRYLCPLGGFLGLLSKVALFRRAVSVECKGCTICTQVCPTGTVDPLQGYASDPSECTMCLDCLESCPRSTIQLTPRLSLAAWNHYDPSRRQALASFGIAIAGIALFRSNALAKREDPFNLRPPGARENDLIDKCVRCGECMRTCPTSALQPALSESGLEGLWTPLVVPRLGYCDYSCNACGQVCPVQAIPALVLEDKRQQIIGRAYIDQNRCIAWSDHKDCIVCEEMCPLPEKAVYLQEAQVKDGQGMSPTIKLPSVDRELCIGCGICEYKCPVNGESAIRVYVPETELPF